MVFYSLLKHVCIVHHTIHQKTELLNVSCKFKSQRTMTIVDETSDFSKQWVHLRKCIHIKRNEFRPHTVYPTFNPYNCMSLYMYCLMYCKIITINKFYSNTHNLNLNNVFFFIPNINEARPLNKMHRCSCNSVYNDRYQNSPVYRQFSRICHIVLIVML